MWRDNRWLFGVGFCLISNFYGFVCRTGLYRNEWKIWWFTIEIPSKVTDERRIDSIILVVVDVFFGSGYLDCRLWFTTGLSIIAYKCAFHQINAVWLIYSGKKVKEPVTQISIDEGQHDDYKHHQQNVDTTGISTGRPTDESSYHGPIICTTHTSPSPSRDDSVVIFLFGHERLPQTKRGKYR